MFKSSRIKIIAAIMAALLLFLLIMAGMIYGSSYRELSKENREMLEKYSSDFDLSQAYMEDSGSGFNGQPEMPAFPGGPYGPGSRDNGEPGDTGESAEPTEPGGFDEPGFSGGTGEPAEPGEPGGFDEPAFPDGTGEPEWPEEPDPGVNPGTDDGLRPPSPLYKEDRGMHAFAVSSFYYTAFDHSGRPILTGYGNGSVYSEEDICSLATEILKSGKTRGTADDLIYQVTDKGGYTLVAFMDNAVVKGNMDTLLKYVLISFGISAVLVFFLALFLSKRIISPLEENDRRQKQFISDAGHELKTPISVMSTNLELLSREMGEDNQWLSNIKYENERMSDLVKDLLELSRAESSATEHQDLDLSTLVTGETLPFESIAFEQGLTLNSDIPEGIRVQGDPAQLRQLTAILLDNAISHSEGEDAVEIGLSEDRHQAILAVTNSGPEIPEDVRDKLFERFYRTDEARTGDDSGHYGLGLAIAKAIVQAHSGTIGCNCSDGKVTFRVTLPMK